MFNVKSHGASGGGAGLQTSAFQAAIDACHDGGGGVVVVPAGSFVVGSLRMRSNVRLRLESGAVLLGSTDLVDYAAEIQGAVEAPAFDKCLIYAEDAENISFEGFGVVDGRGSPEAFPVAVGGTLADRPMLMRLVNCKRITCSDMTFRNPASWGIHLVACRKVRFERITMESKDNNYNSDGLDLDGCSDVVIENCRISTGDDAICLKSTTLEPCSNIMIRNCVLSSDTAGFKLGTSSRGGFMDVKLTDTHFHDCPMGAIKLLLVDGGRMERVELSRLTMENVGGPLFVRLGNRGRLYHQPTEQVYGAEVHPEGAGVGHIRGLLVRDLQAKVTGSQLDRQGIMITGIPGHRVENITLENVRVVFTGPALDKPVTHEVPEDAARYPEQFYFGTLPSWGLYARHVDGLVMRNVRIDRTERDARSPFHLQNVGQLSTSYLFVNGREIKLEASPENTGAND